MTIFVEYLTLLKELTFVFPRLGRGSKCFFIDATRPALILAKVFERIVGTEIRALSFRLIDIRDEKGQFLRWRLHYKDLIEVRAEILKDPEFRRLLEGSLNEDRLPTFLAKALSLFTFSNRQTLWRALLVIQIFVWKARREQIEKPVLLLERRPWFYILQRYASRFGLQLVPGPPSWRSDLRSMLKSVLGPGGSALKRFLVYKKNRVDSLGAADSSGFKIAVEYYGHLNLKRPEYYSDMFFLRGPELSARNLLVLFGIPQDPLTPQKWEEISSLGISALATHPKATEVSNAPLFEPQIRWKAGRREKELLAGLSPSIEGRWLKSHLHQYFASRAFWEDLFAQHRVKLFITWYKYDGAHCPIADALEGLGGVTAIYQRAYEAHPSAETLVAVDLLFAFSPRMAEMERRSGSKIRYHVATGYVGDYRFPLLKEGAQKIRQQLQRHGARRILAFTDEGSIDDTRWHTGHEFQRENYAFLLQKVLRESWFGLAIKPKDPSSLRRRLGKVSKLLEEAEKTGRCFVYQEGGLNSSIPPAAAALASDALIHGHLSAGTAAVESALVGVPTLLLDREGWPLSPLYRLGLGKVVFNDWDTFWAILYEHWHRPEGVPGFGDWTLILEEMDPFRDGRAAERIGTYLAWLLDGFKGGLSRETVLADAAQRYAERWGADKVTSVL
ncbi:MAG: hypothetical protein HY211_06115 [Candidatus Omnitrophica bacterium]|nr:hypothetical protein [Candidatus Omnitrophota bacterium]